MNQSEKLLRSIFGAEDKKGHATPKNHTPTGNGPEGYTQMPPFKASESSSAKNRRRAKNRVAKASRKKNRSR